MAGLLQLDITGVGDAQVAGRAAPADVLDEGIGAVDGTLLEDQSGGVRCVVPDMAAVEAFGLQRSLQEGAVVIRADPT